jgi:internalin A
MIHEELLAIIAQAKQEKATVLDLSNMGFKTVPPEISQLTYLKRIFLSNNQITEFPEAVTNLFSLEDLSLSNNQISEIPDAIGKLVNLKELSLWGNKISKISDSIVQLENLEEIDLSRNHIVVIPISVMKLSSLKRLRLENNQIREIPSEISQLKKLGHLSLHSNEIREIPSSISQMTDLKTLSLYCNQIREIPEAVCHIPKLEDLSLFSNHLRKIPKSISQLETLKKLWLSLNQISEIPDEIGRLSNLQELDVRNNQIVDIPDTISQLKKLQILDLAKNQISSIPISIASLDKLIRLDLHSNQIHDIPEALFELTSLSYLDLSENQIAKNSLDIIESKDAKRIFSYLLNQNWISEARESLLSDEIINTNAIFTLDDLSRILDPLSYPRDRYTALIDLMKELEFCFAIDCHPQQFLIPSILPKDEPKDMSLQGETLEFQYHYHVLPDSVISRFIVLTSDYIHNQTYWRSGVMLEDKENGEVLNIALIKVYPEDKKIFIAISGREKTRRSFLKTIRDIFKKIHKSLNAEVTEWVPVPNHPDLKPLGYQKLLSLEGMGESTVPIPQLRKKIDLRQLLDGYEDIGIRQRTQTGLNVEVLEDSPYNISVKINDYRHSKTINQNGRSDNIAGDKVEGHKIG